MKQADSLNPGLITIQFWIYSSATEQGLIHPRDSLSKGDPDHSVVAIDGSKQSSKSRKYNCMIQILLRAE
jgi:hypothetical protein